jgi:small subunit ribosomal protein S19
MSRSLKKRPYTAPRLLEKFKIAKSTGSKVKTWSRSSTIMIEMVGTTVSIHNGKAFLDVFITEDMIGYKLGDFAPTTKFKGHGGKKAKAA